MCGTGTLGSSSAGLKNRPGRFSICSILKTVSLEVGDRAILVVFALLLA
jgi:hypothetical protein